MVLHKALYTSEWGQGLPQYISLAYILCTEMPECTAPVFFVGRRPERSKKGRKPNYKHCYVQPKLHIHRTVHRYGMLLYRKLLSTKLNSQNNTSKTAVHFFKGITRTQICAYWTNPHWFSQFTNIQTHTRRAEQHPGTWPKTEWQEAHNQKRKSWSDYHRLSYFLFLRQVHAVNAFILRLSLFFSPFRSAFCPTNFPIKHNNTDSTISQRTWRKQN